MSFSEINNSRSGQSLVEALIAVSVVMMGLMGALSLLSNSIGLSRTVADNYLGTYLATEGIEVIKNTLDHNAILISEGMPGVSWNDDICTFANSAFELDYRTKDLSAARLNGFAAFSINPLVLNTATNAYGYDLPGTSTGFTRTVKTSCSGDEIKVQSIVRWKARGGSDSQVILEDKFYNWR